MEKIKQKLERILNKVQKPSRYVGGEYNQIVKPRDAVNIRIALCFPDTYEIGMSNLGLRILYGVFNSIDDVWCERVFAPWPDMEKEMRHSAIPLYGLESFDAISDFDIIAFSLGYELSYTNVLNMLDLANIPLSRAERDDKHPLIIAGGTCCYNPEPMDSFFDLLVIGDGEEVSVEIIDLYRNMSGKDAFLRAASKCEGVYVPMLQEVSPQTVTKRVVKDLDTAYFPVDTIIPSTRIVHDRAVLELFRGCARRCKFCQAGNINAPMRMRSLDTLTQQAMASIKNSGYDEIALLSLSTSDYPYLGELCEKLIHWCEPRKVNLSLPSLRADNFNITILEQVQKVRKSGLTFAPEAGSQRLREYINKNITEDELLNACRLAFSGGWNSVKLYFMLGLPTETDEDVLAIADISHAVLDTWHKHTVNKKRGVRITVSTSCFIPKPHTPFEREEQIEVSEYLRRVGLIKSSIRSKSIVYNYHSPEQGYIEAALSRGDKHTGKVIKAAWQAGARFDSWSEYFSLDLWVSAFEKSSIDPDFYARRKRSQDEKLPWEIVATKIKG